MDNLPPPPRPRMLLRQLGYYPWYSVLRDNIDEANPLPGDLNQDQLHNLAERLTLYLRLHPGVKLRYDQILNLDLNGQLGGAKKRKSKKTSKKVSKKKSSKKTKSQVGGAKRRKSKKSSKKSSKKNSKKTSRK